MATFTNMATLSYNGNVIHSNIVTGVLQDVLSAAKTAVIDNYAANDDITYVISIVNPCSTAFTDLTVTDDLGAYDGVVPLTYIDGSAQYYANGVLQPDPSVTANTSLVISGITVPANGSAILIYQANVNQFAPLETGSVIVNTATISGAGLTASITVEETITVRDEAVLSITKSLNPVTVPEDGEITYTFVVQNTGNTAAGAEDGIVITDQFDPILNDLTVTFDDDAMEKATDYTYDEASGLFNTVAGRITVPAATYVQAPDGSWVVSPGTATLTVSGTVAAALSCPSEIIE